ncbi:transglutaminase TgpA family protein [Leptolyngbya sp. AN03gr2]|uniref:transglutaminase TgpA family protein n=1 Tax=unclassified Leptolyngbya TaxID=2650499 RepID=UPI003D31FC3B
MKNWWQQVQARIQAIPEAKPEESILFRVLTQSLVSVGILATDLAAETQLALWAIPLSAIGAYWSWHRRGKKNVGFKFLLAIAMTIVLFSFFGKMFGNAQSGDNRLLLAEFLIQIQVLHSFDLPRRKDLGYSMIIGLVLLSVASTLSQTMLFGAMLLVFLAIALPVLMLDYCSRLGVDVVKLERTSFKKINFRVLPAIFAIVLALGLVIFAFMPRLPGYQLRMFPVSSPVSVHERFDNRVINNPGSPSSGELRAGIRGGSTGQGRGRTQEGDPSADFYAGFGDKINQNQRGRLKPRAIMRVRSQIEGFWRVMAFDRYTGQGWEVSRNDKTQTVKRLPWSYRFILPTPVSVNRTREVVQTFSIISDMPNLLPALDRAREVYFPTDEIAIDPEAGLRSPINLGDGITYSVVSAVPYRDRTLLRLNSLRAQYPQKSPHLQIPPSIAQQVAAETNRILATSENSLDADYEKALYLGQYLKQRYRIQQEFKLLEPNEDLVLAFLKNQGGDRDHFSTALTVMLRSIGIPARLVAGYAPGQFNPFTGLYIVRNTDAYAMTEMFVPRMGWFTIDPIPGHELIPPSVEDYQPFSLLQRFWSWVASWLPLPVTAWISEVIRIVGNAIGWFLALFTQGLQGFFTATLIIIGSSMSVWLIGQGWQKWRYYRRMRKLQPMERLYQQMLSQLASQGYRKSAADTPLEYARSAKKVQNDDRSHAIREISEAYVRWRYGREKPEIEELRQRLKVLKSRQKVR